MKYKATMPLGQSRTLANIKKARLKEFEKPNLESQCITKINEIKNNIGESVWDYE